MATGAGGYGGVYRIYPLEALQVRQPAPVSQPAPALVPVVMMAALAVATFGGRYNTPDRFFRQTLPAPVSEPALVPRPQPIAPWFTGRPPDQYFAQRLPFTPDTAVLPPPVAEYWVEEPSWVVYRQAQPLIPITQPAPALVPPIPTISPWFTGQPAAAYFGQRLPSAPIDNTPPPPPPMGGGTGYNPYGGVYRIYPAVQVAQRVAISITIAPTNAYRATWNGGPIYKASWCGGSLYRATWSGSS